MADLSAASPVAAPQIEGVSLEQYAGVSAAMIEGFALPAVLASEGLDAGAWPRVSLRWSQRLAKDGAGGPLAASFRATLAFARGWLGRRVVPLEDHLGAWLAFLNVWSAHPAPFDMLDRLGMSPSDVARIQGTWAKRIEENEMLRDKAFELARRKARALPSLIVTPAELKPFPWTKKRVDEPADEPLERPKMLSQSYIGDAIGMERYASLHADLGRAPKGGAAAILAKHTLDEAGFAALEVRWRGRFTADPTLAQDFRRLVRYYEARLVARGTKGGAPRGGHAELGEISTPVARPVAALLGTALAFDVPQGPSLPFVPGAAAAGAITAPDAQAPKVARPPAKFAGTALAVDMPAKPALPFEGMPEAPKPARPPAGLVGTALAMEAPSGPALPFAEGAAPTAGIAAPLPGEAAKVALPSAKLGATALSVEAPTEAVLPFAAAADAPKPVRAPALTLDQHASLTAEIALAPERALETLGRYQLTPEAKRALDEHYRGQVAASAEVREAWNRAYQAHYAWCVQARAQR